MRTPRDDPVGALLLDKPAGPTSHDMVDRARRALGMRRIGHAGTLDPFATGLLLLCVGRATRLVEYLHLLPKTYEAELRLGAETETHDPEGATTRVSEAWRELGEERMRRALAATAARREQRPPVFSAKRVGGRRAHEAARRGENPALEPVPVRVHRCELVEFDPPTARLDLVVSTGTYVRALARDLGRDLGCYAHLSALRRTAIGPFDVRAAVSAGRLEREGRALLERERGTAWLSPARTLAWLPRRDLDEVEAARVGAGSPIPEGRVRPPEEGAGPYPGPAGVEAGDRLPVALLHGERLLAVARRERGDLRPAKVFAGA